jgi:hypothetical protein
MEEYISVNDAVSIMGAHGELAVSICAFYDEHGKLAVREDGNYLLIEDAEKWGRTMPPNWVPPNWVPPNLELVTPCWKFACLRIILEAPLRLTGRP